jgi:hypothetical protein
MPSCTASNPSHDFVLVYPLCCNDDRAGEIGRTFHFMTRHDLVLANDTTASVANASDFVQQTLSQVPPLASIRAEFLHGGTCDKVLTVLVSCDRTTL